MIRGFFMNALTRTKKNFTPSTMKYFFLFLLSLVLQSFVPPTNPQIFPTNLEITVRDEVGNVVEGASVRLFKTQEDYDKGQKPVQETRKTDAKGRVVFRELEAIEYYVQAEKGDLDNAAAGVKTNVLTPKKTNKITVIIS
jgi:hypothetical protein